MNLETAKEQVLELILKDINELGLDITVDQKSPDRDEGKFSINGRPARTIAPFNGFYVNISLRWFMGSKEIPKIKKGEFYYYVFALTGKNNDLIENYFICDYIKLREWVLEFDAPTGNDHKDHHDWRGEIEYLGDLPYSKGYFRWGDEPKGEERITRYITINNIAEITGTTKKVPESSIYLIFSYKEDSPWDDDFGKSYHYGRTVPNYTKVRAGAKFLLLKKNIGFVGSGEIDNVETEDSTPNGPQKFRAVFKDFKPMDPPIKLSDEIRNAISSLPGYNVQHSIKVVNEDIFDMILSPTSHSRRLSWYDYLQDDNLKNRAWIFQANPKLYDIESALRSLSEIRWSIRQHKDEIKKGDVIFIWQSGPKSGVLGVGEVSSDPIEMPDDEKSKAFVRSPEAFIDSELRSEVQIIKVLQKPLQKQTLMDHPILKELKILKAPQGTNFEITPAQFEALNELISKNQTSPTPEPDKYSKAQALKDLFIKEKDFEYIVNRLKDKKNIILQGPPGVGKTFIAKRLAYYLMRFKDDDRLSMIQFHQSYSYEDFIQGFRPNQDGKFNLRNGIFYEFCSMAMQNENKPYVFIIDEINRGNLSKIFGEMLMLIESDKRGADFSVSLTYGNGNSDKFYIPNSVYLIGTMNTADRSLAMVDYALRRRFGFIDLVPQFKNPKFTEYLKTFGVGDGLIRKIVERMTSLNETIAEDTKNLGPGYRIGHSYFCASDSAQSYDEEWYRNVIKSEIKPLLNEYWFDDPKRVADLVSELLS